MSDNDGVTQLLKAEAEANKIIKEAQEEKDREVKKARAAAAQEIEEFRKQEEQRLQAEIKKRFGNTQEEEDLEVKTQEDIKEINKAYEARKGAVIDLLIERVMNVDLEIPQIVKRALTQKK